MCLTGGGVDRVDGAVVVVDPDRPVKNRSRVDDFPEREVPTLLAVSVVDEDVAGAIPVSGRTDTTVTERERVAILNPSENRRNRSARTRLPFREGHRPYVPDSGRR